MGARLRIWFNFSARQFFLHPSQSSTWVVTPHPEGFWLKLSFSVRMVSFGPQSSFISKAAVFKVLLIKSSGGLFLWDKLSYLGWFGPLGQSRVHEGNNLLNEESRCQKLWKFANILNGWSLTRILVFEKHKLTKFALVWTGLTTQLTQKAKICKWKPW